jgi:hypothetical protein
LQPPGYDHGQRKEDDGDGEGQLDVGRVLDPKEFLHGRDEDAPRIENAEAELEQERTADDDPAIDESLISTHASS